MWGKRLSGRSWVLAASLLCLLFGAAGTAPQADAYQSGHHGYWRWHWHRPAVASVSPSSGPAAGGTSVTISGANFTHATAVKFGSTAATSFVVDSATEITAVSPAGAGTVKVTVATPAGTSCSPTYYSYLPSPAVTGVSPSAGPAAGGTSVTITGSYFTNATAVGFGTTPATSFTVDSDSQITASAPAGTGIVDVTVASLGGTSTTSSSDEYTYEEPPTAQVLSPETGGTYNLNQAVPTAFSCTDGTGGPGIEACTDSNDATNGTGTLDTSTPGPHTYTVTATSQDGQTGTATITYTVAGPPTAQITTPEGRETYNLNQAVPTTFICTEDPNGPGIQSCTDSGGATDDAGELDTSTPGPHTYTVTATSQDGQTGTATITYTVAGPPTAQITTPEGGETYNLNQNVPTAFSCTDDPNGPGIQTCTDSNGASNGSGALDTTTPGPHTYTVTATSQDGQTDTATINYTVAGPPTAQILSPEGGETYNLNQNVATAFSCTDDPNGPGIQTCTDSNGASNGIGMLDTTTPGPHTYAVTATSQDGQTNTATINYTVAGPPTAQITTPQTGQTYNLNQNVPTTFTCTDDPNGPGIQTCTDSNGASNGTGTLDTSTPGPHTYTVTATSQDGQTNTATINYTVAQATPQPATDGGVAAAKPPAVIGGAATSETSNGAALSGSVNPEGAPTNAYFQYGLDLSDRGPGASTTLYDQSTASQPVGSDSSDHTVSVPLSGLIPGALYHVRLVAINSAGTTFGVDETFTTPTAAAPPPPVLGKSEDVSPVTGIVFIKSPSGAYVPLTGATQIGTGTQIDALNGSLQLVASVGKNKKEHGIFGGAVFKLTQAGSGIRKGFTTLTTVESAFKGAPSYSLCTKHTAADASVAKASSRTVQLLHASAHGKFTTKGRYGAATVLGTKWTIADLCNGTLVHDITDSVKVTDFVQHKTIIIHAGQSYLVRAPTHRG